MTVKLVTNHEKATCRVPIRMTKRQKTELQKWCHANGLTMTTLFKTAAQEYIKNHDKDTKKAKKTRKRTTKAR